MSIGTAISVIGVGAGFNPGRSWAAIPNAYAPGVSWRARRVGEKSTATIKQPLHNRSRVNMEKRGTKKIYIGLSVERDWVDRVDAHQRRCNGSASWSSYWRQAIRDRMIHDGLLNADAA